MSIRVLITGESSYLGSILTPKLLSLGYVTVVDNFMYQQTSYWFMD